VGQVVEWDNSGSVAHNVTFDEAPTLTSDTMSSGDKHQVKFTKAGTYSYHCTFHPGMEGQITVS
jgi:plastocyanin